MFDLLGYLGASPATVAIVMAGFLLAGGFVCVKFAPAVIAATGKKDPGEVVVDEVAGLLPVAEVHVVRDLHHNGGRIFAVQVLRESQAVAGQKTRKTPKRLGDFSR